MKNSYFLLKQNKPIRRLTKAERNAVGYIFRGHYIKKGGQIASTSIVYHSPYVGAVIVDDEYNWTINMLGECWWRFPDKATKSMITFTSDNGEEHFRDWLLLNKMAHDGRYVEESRGD